MGSGDVLRFSLFKAGNYLQSCGDRWSHAAKRLSKGGYTSEDLLTDLKDSTGDMVDLWFGSLEQLMGIGGPPVFPSGNLTTPCDNQTEPNATITLDEPVPPKVQPILSDLINAADSTQKLLAGKHVEIDFVKGRRDELEVRYTPDPKAFPQAGVYHGLVQVEGVPVAVVVFNLT